MKNFLSTTYKYKVFKSTTIAQPQAQVPRLKIDLITAKNINNVLRFRNASILKFFERFHSSEDAVGVLAYVDGTVIGHQWSEFNPRRKACFSLEDTILKPGELGFFFGYVDPKYRGKRIHHYMKTAICNELLRKDRKILFVSHGQLTNPLSLRSNHLMFLDSKVYDALKCYFVFGLITVYVQKASAWGIAFRFPKTQKKFSFIVSRSRTTGDGGRAY